MRTGRLRVRPRVVTLLAVLVLATAPAARAAGPLIVNGAGTPLVWTANPIPYNPDRGTLGTRSNAQAVGDVSANFGVWAAVATSTVTFSNTGAMPVDVTAANYETYLGICNDGLNPIIFDTNGTITDDLFGSGASNSILGFAGPDCGSFLAASITEGSAVLNGKWIDGVSNPSNPEMSLAEFNTVFIHEFGHYFNLDHSQINRSEASDGNPSNDNAIATMYPFLVNGSEQASLNLDDRVSVSTLYPAASFATSFGRIEGSILLPDGEGAFQGGYAIARQVGDPRVSAVGAASGARFFPAHAGGPPTPGLRARYELPGLPPGSYTVEIEAIDPSFTGGSGLGPLDPPVPLPGPPEFWNGASEGNANPPDNPASSQAITVGAGQTVTAIDVVINGAVTGPANDPCTAPAVISATPFSTSLATTAATTGIYDPFQACSTAGPKQNSKSVWYSFTPAVDGTMTASTRGSNYDTVLSVYTGACGSLTEVACNDDSAPGLNSQVTMPVTGGTAYLLEITSFSTSAGGTLALSVTSTEPAPVPVCAATPEACRTPVVSQKAQIILKDKLHDAKDLLVWKWIKGAATTKAELADPVNTDSYTLCIYDGGGLISSATMLAGGLCYGRPCWTEKSSGYKYRDKTLTADGVQSLVVRAGEDERAKIVLKAKGENLIMPDLTTLTSPVTVQLKKSGGLCWGAVYSFPPVQKMDEGQFRDKAD